MTARQQNSRMCFVCGLSNPAGLRAAFFELESGEVVALFTPTERHQSYPGRLHGVELGAVGRIEKADGRTARGPR